jgi:hypothetical protein
MERAKLLSIVTGTLHKLDGLGCRNPAKIGRGRSRCTYDGWYSCLQQETKYNDNVTREAETTNGSNRRGTSSSLEQFVQQRPRMVLPDEEEVLVWSTFVHASFPFFSLVVVLLLLPFIASPLLLSLRVCFTAWGLPPATAAGPSMKIRLGHSCQSVVD